ncbi:transposase [Enterococcus sp. DIV1420a]|uniref:transposase n=1 Tax=Enterococcus sp. DIV1420a TaxID=2774672 RepID=UPI003F299C95
MILTNPQCIKGIPGRKTDQNDVEWIAQLNRVGLIPQNYVPPTDIQELRSLTRTRTHLITERTQHKNRIHNILQQGNIKLTGFLSDIHGKTGRKLVDLLLSGEKIEVEKEGCIEVILSEIGPDITAFKTQSHLASWAELCPVSYESGGVRKNARIGGGNKYLRTALYHADRTAAHSNSAIFAEFYQRIAGHGSKQKAINATAHKILRIVYRALESIKKATAMIIDSHHSN